MRCYTTIMGQLSNNKCSSYKELQLIIAFSIPVLRFPVVSISTSVFDPVPTFSIQQYRYGSQLYPIIQCIRYQHSVLSAFGIQHLVFNVYNYPAAFQRFGIRCSIQRSVLAFWRSIIQHLGTRYTHHGTVLFAVNRFH
jgi:hypothetical protein